MIDFYTQVGKYLDGHLSEADRLTFETELNTNEELRHAVENHDVMEGVLDMLWEDDAREVAMKARESAEEIDLGDEVVDKKPNKLISIRKFMSYAASLVALVMVGFLLMQQLNSSTNVLYAASYTEFQSTVKRGVNDNLSNLSLCDKGHALMDTEEFNLAIETFKNSLLTEDSCYEKSQWYLTLCYLKLDQVELRDSMLNVITANTSHKYIDIANKLSKKL